MSAVYFANNHHRLLHKSMLYLIIINYVLLFLSFRYSAGITLIGGFLLSFFLIVYNILLGKLVLRLTRRCTDGYILYPLIFSYFLLSAFILKFFLLP